MKTAFTVCFVWLQFVLSAQNPESEISSNWIYFPQFSTSDRDTQVLLERPDLNILSDFKRVTIFKE